MRTPTKPALESILALPISGRPSASDVYVVPDSTAMQDASRLMAALVSAGEPDCISTFCQERQNHMVTLMQTMGAELDGFAANIGPSPQDRRVDKCAVTQYIALAVRSASVSQNQTSYFFGYFDPKKNFL